MIVGSIWQGTTRDHRWKVKVLSSNTTTITFTVLRGSGTVKGARRCLPRPAFLRAYRRV